MFSLLLLGVDCVCFGQDLAVCGFEVVLVVVEQGLVLGGIMEGAAGKGAQGLLGVLQGGGSIVSLLAMLVIQIAEDGGGQGIDGPEGADDGSGSGDEEAAGQGEDVVGEVGCA